MTDDLNLLQWISNSSGQVFEPQLVTLKRVALLLGGSAVTATIDTGVRSIHYQFESAVRESAAGMLRQATAVVLGPSWTVSIAPEEPDDRHRKGRGPAKRKGAGGVQEVRRRR